MIKAKSLYHLIVYSIAFIVILISFFTFIIINNAFNEFQEKIIIIKDDYEIKQKETIRQDIHDTMKFIHYYHKKHKGTKSEREIQNDVLNAIENMRDTNDINDYVFIYNFDGTSIYYPASKQDIGKNLYEFTDPTGKKVIKELINVSQDNAGGFVEYVWYKPELEKEVPKISYAVSYKPWNWTIGQGIYLDEIENLVRKKRYEYDEKISNYVLQILSLTIMLVLYSIFIYKNATILIVNDVREIGKYFKETQKSDQPINDKNIMFGEFKMIANYANDAITNIKDKTHMLEALNIHLEDTVKEQTKELTALVGSQKKFLKNSVHEINTPLSIIQTNIDLLRMHTPNNKYINNIQSGAKTIQYIFDDLSYLIKKDKVIYQKETLNFSEFLIERLSYFDEIAQSNTLFFVTNIQNPIYHCFNGVLLQRVIDNNLSNSIKYSFKDSPIFVKLLEDDNGVIFEVKTHSKQIENIDKIYDDFYRENNARGGFGLGLRIVKDICDKNSVIIEINSNKDETKFTYRFKKDENTAA